MPRRREVLIARRRAAGHTQESLAAKLGVERSTVVRWELGASTPQPWRRPELAVELSVTLDDLNGLLADLDHAADRATGLVSALTAAPEDLPARLRRRTARLRRLDDYLGGADTYPLYASELNATSALVDDAGHSEGTRRALLSVLAEQSQLAGWAAFDAGQQAEATRLYTASRSAAEQAGDRELLANALAFLAYQQVSTSGGGVDVAVASCEAVGDDAAPTVRALLWERRAWAHAVAGQPHDTARSLAVAEEALGRDASSAPPDWSCWVDHTELQIMTGRCWAELGRPLRAVPLLESVLAHFDDTHARDKALYLTWLVRAYLDAGEVEQATAVTGRALELSVGVTSVRPRLRIDALLRRLEPHRTLSPVAELLDRAAA